MNGDGDADLTVMIDYEKYQQAVRARRHPRNARSIAQIDATICADLEREEYRNCGNKCVLGCRYDAAVSENITVTDDCDATECIEGCFCKDGFVRYHKKCVLPATECPARKSKTIGKAYDMPSYPSKILGLFRPCGPYGCRPNCMSFTINFFYSL